VQALLLVLHYRIEDGVLGIGTGRPLSCTPVAQAGTASSCLFLQIRHGIGSKCIADTQTNTLVAGKKDRQHRAEVSEIEICAIHVCGGRKPRSRPSAPESRPR
jgi:hypothetical protein